MQQSIIATIKHIIFSNDNYYIVKIREKDSILDLTAKGYMDVLEGQEYELTGSFLEDDKYGEYFNVVSCKEKEIDGEDGFLNYMSSSRFEGIGKRTSKKIWDAFQEDSINVIKNDSERLYELDLSENQIEEIIKKTTDSNLQNDLFLELKKFSFTDNLINKIYSILNKKEELTINDLKENPFILIDNILEFGFDMADKMYITYNDDLINYNRILYASRDVFNKHAYKHGDTMMEYEELNTRVSTKLKLETNVISNLINEFIDAKEIFIVDNYVQIKEFYYVEKGIAQNIKLRINYGFNRVFSINEEVIDEIEKDNNIEYSENQRSAILSSIENNISIITGGPGTGKTTIIKAIIDYYLKTKYNDLEKKEYDTKIMLTAPTGRAAQRMKDATKINAKTIHSMLGWDPHSNLFYHNMGNPLGYEIIIIDEASMIDSFLFYNLLKAIKAECKIIIVGDYNQLESVGPGKVLNDLIESGCINTKELDFIYRQKAGSSISQFANDIQEGRELSLENTADMSIINLEKDILETVHHIKEKSMLAGYKDMEVQVLFPNYKGKLGIDSLNGILKPDVIEEEKKILFSDRVYQVGDKIMQLKNDYENDIYNGDIGYVRRIYNEDGSGNELALQVEIRELYIDISWKQLEDITHAYAISIHKSQGSEFDVVILPVGNEMSKLMTKKLLYTAITRAKKKLVVIGNINNFLIGIKSMDYVRETRLRDYLMEE